MALTDAEVAYLKSELGSDLDVSDANARFLRLGKVQHVALEVLRGRLADLLRDPASVTTPQGVHVDNSKNIDALQKQLLRVALEIPDDTTGDVPPLPQVTTVQLTSRHSRRGLGRGASERDRASRPFWP